jgi:hypothetical protein
MKGEKGQVKGTSERGQGKRDKGQVFRAIVKGKLILAKNYFK